MTRAIETGFMQRAPFQEMMTTNPPGSCEIFVRCPPGRPGRAPPAVVPSPVMGKAILSVLAVILLIFIGHGAFTIWDQQRKITTFLPAEATVLSSQAEPVVRRGS